MLSRSGAKGFFAVVLLMLLALPSLAQTPGIGAIRG